MSDAQKRLQSAMARRAESYEDRQAREALERAEAEAFFEQTIVSGFRAAADDINQQGAAQARPREPSPRAEIEESPRSPAGMYIDFRVRRGGTVEFGFRGMARMRGSTVQWKYRRSPRIKRDGTYTFDGTDRELQWDVPMTPEQIRDDLLSRYAEVLDAIARRRGQ